MPTYDYQCRDCGNVIEVIHSMLEDGPTTCERCGGELRRVIYPSGIIFKGSGFYRTDSRASGSGSESTAAAASSGSDGQSTDTKSPKDASSSTTTGASTGSTNPT